MSQDCDHAKQRGPKLPEAKYADRTCMLIRWSQYFSAPAGYPSGQAYFTSTAPAIRQDGPTPKALTDYCLVLGGQRIQVTREHRQSPECWDTDVYKPQRSYSAAEDKQQGYYTSVDDRLIKRFKTSSEAKVRQAFFTS
eukprot:12296254-Heterocapsa_arctica.AAC.1